MPEHVLRAGREVIDSLAALGKALGYGVEREWPLPEGTAAVDLAWLREPSDTAPLFAFEIESRAGEGIASNAMKILGRAASVGAKPLHLFHVVVRGGLKSRRPIDASTEFAGHNYTIHLLESPAEPSALLAAILDAHRRVTAAVDGIAFGSALREPLWSDIAADTAMHLLDDRGFDGVRGRPVAVLALQRLEFRPTLVRHLLDNWDEVFGGGRPPPNRYLEATGHSYGAYGSYMAEAACEGLELGLVARLSPEHREAAFRALEGWQEANHIGDSLGPYTGAGVQWTQYAVGHLGYYWALLSALFAEVPHAAGWCASQPLKLVEALHPSIERALLALWVMHALPNDPQYQTSYQAAAEAVREVGGIAASWIARPSPANPDSEFAEDEEWTALAPRDATALVPTAAELRELVRVSGVSQADPVDLSLKALLDDPADRPADGGALVAYLARQ